MDISLIQPLLMALGLMGFGILLLIYGGNWTIDSAVYVARRFGLSPMVVGFTIIAFGTSLPELIVSVLANFQGSPGIAIGNVLGSNIANILLVIALTAVMVTLRVSSKAVYKDLGMMMASTVLLTFIVMSGEIGRLAGVSMVLLLIFYSYMQYKMANPEDAMLEEEEISFSKPMIAYGFLLLGLIGIAIGAEFLVRGAKMGASTLGVPEAVIALSIIALGTSLPELSTCIIAGRKGHSDIVFGNIIGSNVFNILMILGIASLAKPIAQGSFAEQLVNFDIWVVLIVSLIFSFILVMFKSIGRVTGIIFFTLYIAYNIFIYAQYMVS